MNSKRTAISFLISALLILSACGGGGGGTDATPPPIGANPTPSTPTEGPLPGGSAITIAWPPALGQNAWQIRSTGKPIFAAVVTGGGSWLARQVDGAVWTSADAATWTKRVPFDENMGGGDVTYFRSNFYIISSTVVSGQAVDFIASSPNGMNWTIRYTGTICSERNFRSRITSTSSHLFFWCQGSQKLYSSIDGTSWILESISDENSIDYIAHIAESDSHIAIVGNYFKASDAPVVVSFRPKSATVWSPVTKVAVSTGSTASGMTWGKGVWVVSLPSGEVFDSADRATWTKRDTGVSLPPGSLFGLHPSRLVSVFFALNKFYVVTAGGTVITSSDGVTWSPAGALPSGGPSFGYTVAATNAGVIAVATDGGIAVSSGDGNWRTTVNPDILASRIAFGGGRFVLCGSDGSGEAVYHSQDGTQWTRAEGVSLGTDKCSQSKIRYFDGRFELGRYVSSDGMSWTRVISAYRNYIFPSGLNSDTLRFEGKYFHYAPNVQTPLYEISTDLINRISVKPNIELSDHIVWTLSPSGKLFSFAAENLISSTNGSDWVIVAAMPMWWRADCSVYGFEDVTLPIYAYCGDGAFSSSIFSSDDGLKWIESALPETPGALVVRRAGDLTYLLDNHVYIKSGTGSWQREPMPLGDSFHDIASGNGRSVLIGRSGAILVK